MKYDIRLSISHHYAQPAGSSRHLIRVLPRSIPGRQSVTAHLIEVSPTPDERSAGMDFFGNATTTVSHGDPHDQMTIRMTSRVELSTRTDWLDLSPDLAQLRQQWEAYQGLEPGSPLHFLGPSPRLSPNSEIAHFAQGILQAGDSSAGHVIRLGQALHDAMSFDPEATTVDTDAPEAFRLRRGVCQDFSHIMILALRSLGIPAGYVSGYLRTLPPEGGVRLEGADAMHAWVKAWCGAEHGWLEYDPTNATIAGTDHIVVGYGRDYADASPVIGHLRSSGDQTNTQSVDVVALG
ncbi:transglutaminase family protein [Tropicimonas sp. S265A]|uniref:transglutaminase family protein n=1 Tax=Tropicimonas sp. S265A TaxID=3415134 RepID=UPI003C79DFDE